MASLLWVVLAALLLPSASSFAPRAADWLVDNITTAVTFVQNPDGSYTLSNGLISRTFITRPGFGTVDLYSHARNASLLRAIANEGTITLDAATYALGNLIQTGTYYHAYLNRSAPGIEVDPTGWGLLNFTVSAPTSPIPWTPGARGSPASASWPPRGLTVTARLAPPAGAPPAHAAVAISLVYELYEGAPLLAKWVVVDAAAPAAAGVVVAAIVPEALRLAPPYSPLAFTPYGPSPVQADVTSMLYVTTDQAHSTLVNWGDDGAVPADPGAEEPYRERRG